MGQLADTDTGPGAGTSREQLALHRTKHRHVLAQADMIGGQFHHIREIATGSRNVLPTFKAGR